MKYTIDKYHWFNYFNSITLSLLGTFTIVEIVSAKPICYIIDANGKQVNLSFLCSSAKSSPPATSNTTPLNSKNPALPATNPTNPVTPPQNAKTPETPTSTSTQSETNPTKNSEVDKSKLPATQRAIPLLQNQQTPQIKN